MDGLRYSNDSHANTTTTMTSKIIELGKKIHELAKRGDGGEKETASRMLETFMRKHGLTIEDIEGEKKTFRDFHFKSTMEERLIYQVAANVVGNGAESYGNPSNRNVVAYKLTDAQYVEFDLKYSTWRKLLKEEMEIFYEAFVCQNDIYATDIEPRELSEMTPEQRKKNRRIQEMAENIKRAEIHKQLKSA